MAAPLRMQPSMLVMTVLSVTVAMTTPSTTRAIAEHSIRVSRLFVTTHCTHGNALMISSREMPGRRVGLVCIFVAQKTCASREALTMV